jgi:CDP-diacylglycerol--glycerol-3-phosphate 3-phosphatidyltransferase
VNWPNLITLSRVPTLFAVVVLMFFQFPGAATGAFVLFVLGGVSDWLDGYLARRYHIVSNFGKLMDALTDKVLVVGVMVAMLVPMPANHPATLSSAYLFWVLVIFSREFLITGLRLVAASQGLVLAAERSGKIKTVLQLVSVSVLLLQRMFELDFINLTAAHWVHVVGVVLFVAAAALTAISGAGYLIKYWSTFMGRTGDLKG